MNIGNQLDKGFREARMCLWFLDILYMMLFTIVPEV